MAYMSYITKICVSGLQRQIKFCLKFFDFVRICLNFVQMLGTVVTVVVTQVQNFLNKYVPNYQSEDIPWYARDG